MPQNPLKNPVNAFQFFVDIGDLKAYFMEATGFDNNTDVSEVRHAIEKGKSVIMKVPVTSKWGDITLKRIFTDDNQLFAWRQMVLDGEAEKARKSGSFTGYDEKGAPVIQFTIDRCWPTKWKGPSFNAKSNDPAIEEITLAHEGLKRVV